jgi:RNA polymerase sigma factor (sigma-70 family)
MGFRPEVPPDLVPILSNSGSIWKQDEIDRVKLWICDQTKLRYLLVIAWSYLKTFHAADYKDAEDLVQDFYLKRLDRVVATFDPGKGDFWAYLLVDFKQFRLDEWRKLMRRKGLETPMPVLINEGDATEIGPADLRPENDPARPPEVRETARTVRACIERLGEMYRPIIEMTYFNGELSCKAIAAKLGLTETAVKVRLHRARFQLKECLKGRLS